MDDAFNYWFLQIALALLWCLDLITDLLFGFTCSGGTKAEREAAKFYQNSGHLVSVKWKARYTPFWYMFKNNFLCVHEKYIHPEYILEKRNVSLFTVTKDYALFCVTPPKVDIYNTKQYPFTFIAHYNLCEKLIFLPIDSFHRLSEELGDPKIPVMINHMTARCGSTLLAQMLHRIPDIRVLSEPLGAVPIHEEMARKRISQVLNFTMNPGQ